MTARTAQPAPAQQEIRIVPFGAAHIPGACRLSAAAGWPHRAEDWALTLSVSEGVVALVADSVVGTALATRFGAVAMLNMIIVDARMRGRGLGRTLMQAAMDRAGTAEMRLVATEDGLPLYRKLGFAETGTIVQHQGLAAVPPDAGQGIAVVPGGAADVAELAAMDLAASGLARGPLLAAIAAQGAVLRAPRGFAMLRRFGRGQLLGPVVAADDATARALIAAAARRLPGAFLRLDLPQERGLSPFAESLGLARTGGGTAMCRGATPLPSAPAEGAVPYATYALAAQALG